MNIYMLNMCENRITAEKLSDFRNRTNINSKLGKL